jgi:hypothetical protein
VYASEDGRAGEQSIPGVGNVGHVKATANRLSGRQTTESARGASRECGKF